MRIFLNDYDTNEPVELTYDQLSRMLNENNTQVDVVTYESRREYYFDVQVNVEDPYNTKMRELLLTFDAESTIVINFDSGCDVYITK